MGGYLVQVAGRLFYGSPKLSRPFLSPKASRLGEKPREDLRRRFPWFTIRHGSFLNRIPRIANSNGLPKSQLSAPSSRHLQ